MKRTMWLLVGVLSALMMALVGGAAAESAAPATSEIEPNDTMAQATPIALGITTAANDSAEDVDYFRLDLVEGQSIHIEVANDCDSYTYFEVGVFDAAGNLIALKDGYNPASAVIPEVIIPATGVYYLRVTNPDDFQEETGIYRVAVLLNSAGEPDDDYTDAVPLPTGASISGVLDWPDDYDYFTFEGLAGELVDINLTIPSLYPYPYIRLTQQGTYWSLMESTQTTTRSTITVLLPATGRYEVYTWAPSLRCGWEIGDPASYPASYQISLDRPGFYVSGSAAGKASNVAFGPNDILVRDAGGQWRMVFDGEDAGLRVALSGFEWMPDGSLLLSVKESQPLGALGTVLPHDVVRFTPTALGTTTAGSFEWYLRGANAGLTTPGERIDALGLTTGGDLLISTVGVAKVPAAGGGTLVMADEGILRYRPGGTWESYFDMDDWWFPRQYRGFANEDIVSMTRMTPEDRINAYNADVYFTLQTDYRFTDDATVKRVASKKGDVLGLNWQQCCVSGVQLGATLQTLGFPKPISNLSIGPVWTP